MLRDAILGGDGRVVICLPPRHGKSTLTDLWAPLWTLDLDARKRVILATHTGDYSEFWGRLALDTAREHAGSLDFTVSDRKASAREWETTAGGSMVSVGIGGALTGRGGDVIVVDDPIKDAEQANSETYRQKTWDWYTTTLRTRLEPGGTIVVVLTRWHEDDIVGRLLESDPGRWTVLSFPAIAEEEDALGRKPGEALWPARYGVAQLAEARREVTSHTWEALYQQHPAPPGGAVFQREHFRYFCLGATPDHVVLLEPDGTERREDLVRIWSAQVADTAMTETAESDWTVVLTFGVTQRGDVLVVDVARKRLEVPDQWDYVMAQRQRWSHWGKHRWIGCENKGSGIGLLQLAKRKGVPMRELEAVGDKITRATDAAVFYQRGSVYHLRDAPWLAAYERELCSFPYDAHDDQVDCVAYAVRAIRSPRRKSKRRETGDDWKPRDDGYALGGSGVEAW